MTRKIAHEIAHENWAEYFDWLTKELLHAPVSIATVAPSRPSAETGNLALLELAYDHRGDVFEVAAASGGVPVPTTVRHHVDHPEHIYVDNDVMLAPLTIAVDAPDGARTVIMIENEPEPESRQGERENRDP